MPPFKLNERCSFATLPNISVMLFDTHFLLISSKRRCCRYVLGNVSFLSGTGSWIQEHIELKTR